MARRLSDLAEIPVDRLDGVGPKRRDSLESVGITSVLDLLMHYPRRYIDRTSQLHVDELVPGDEAMVLGSIEKTSTRRMRNGRSMVEAKVTDGSGILYVTFFNQPWRTRQLLSGLTAVFFGKVDLYRGRRQMTNPIVDLIGDKTGRIVPVYPQSEKAGISSSDLAGWIEEALRRAGEFADPLPEDDRRSLDLSTRTWAMGQVHAPESMEYAYAARKRLAFDELLRLQTLLVLRKRALERQSLGIVHSLDGELVDRFLKNLPYSPTAAQQRAIGEIQHDLNCPHPMHRLLQGDVGSGKTLVALVALLTAVQAGHQGAIMAPTEVLAEQHFIGMRSTLEGVTKADDATLLGERPVRVELLTNRTTAAERRRLHSGLQSGEVDILVGTHALLTDSVAFASLGLVVIDEQHRFGVEQRAALRDKGAGETVPDVLVMTATPIPRTAAMTVYGDLDVSVLDELPPGRTPIRTRWLSGEDGEQQVWQALRDEVEKGRQAYVVCPLVDESEKVQAKSATTEFDRLQAGPLAGLKIALLHGQMAADEKEHVMQQFRAAEVDVLVATTVIEVGVDVPNATVMVIEDASRFGIAQLHQLRGRVGRGTHAGQCFLLAEPTSPEVEERLSSVERTTDGFELAEVDLELRGSGSILGVRQKGRSDLKLASLKRRDRELLIKAREVASRIVDADPDLSDHELLSHEVRNMVDEEEATYLFKS